MPSCQFDCILVKNRKKTICKLPYYNDFKIHVFALRNLFRSSRGFPMVMVSRKESSSVLDIFEC